MSASAAVAGREDLAKGEVRMAGHRARLAAVMLLGLACPLVSAPAGAQENLGPKLEILGGGVTLEVSGGDVEARVVIRNSGAGPASALEFVALLDDDRSLDLIAVGGPPSIGPGEILVIQLDGDYGKDNAIEDGLLSVTSGGSLLAVAAITTESTTPTLNVLFPIMGGVLLASTAVLLGGRRHLGNLRHSLAHEAAWQFGSSWAATLTAFGAILGTILGASDVVSAALPGVRLAEFVALSILFGALALLAPVVFLALQIKRDDGSIGGFLLASLFTLTAVSGQLLTVMALFFTADRGSKGAGTVAITMAIAIALTAVVLYGRRSIQWRLPTPGTPAPAAAAVPQTVVLP